LSNKPINLISSTLALSVVLSLAFCLKWLIATDIRKLEPSGLVKAAIRDFVKPIFAWKLVSHFKGSNFKTDGIYPLALSNSNETVCSRFQSISLYLLPVFSNLELQQINE